MRGPPSPGPEVLVVGAGPAGSVTALLLARLGRRVLLVDRSSFPRPKPCGECVNPGAVRILERIGALPAVLKRRPARILGWSMSADEGPMAEGSFDGGAPAGLGISRADLDHVLLQEARAAGVAFRDRLRAVEVEPDSLRPAVIFLDGIGARERVTASAVVAADGLRSVVARRAGLVEAPRSPRKASATFRVRGHGPSRDRGLLYLGSGFTLGLAPVAAHTPLWNLTLVVDPDLFGRELARDPRGLLHRLAGAAPVVWASGPTLVAGPWTSGPFHRPSRGAGAPGVVAVGDAAGYFDPLTGQGIYRALRSAELAAPAVDLALRHPERSARILAAYGDRLRRELAPGRSLQKAIEAVLVRGPLRRPALRGLAGAPGAFDALIRVTGDLAPLRSLARPGPWLGTLRHALGPG